MAAVGRGLPVAHPLVWQHAEDPDGRWEPPTHVGDRGSAYRVTGRPLPTGPLAAATATVRRIPPLSPVEAIVLAG